MAVPESPVAVTAMPAFTVRCATSWDRRCWCSVSGVTEETTVAELRRLLNVRFATAKSSLCHGRVILSDDRCLGEYGVTDLSVLTFVALEKSKKKPIHGPSCTKQSGSRQLGDALIAAPCKANTSAALVPTHHRGIKTPSVPLDTALFVPVLSCDDQ